MFVSNIFKMKIQEGFSLGELLVVVAIIGVLAGVGTVGYQFLLIQTNNLEIIYFT